MTRDQVALGDLAIDRSRLEVRVAGEVAPLTPLEIKLLWILVEEQGRTLSRDEIFTRVWGGERQDGDRSVDVLVRRLRRKVDEAGGRYTYVQTEHKQGYRLEAIPKAVDRWHPVIRRVLEDGVVDLSAALERAVTKPDRSA